MHQHGKKNRVLYTPTMFSTHSTKKIHTYRLSFIMVKISIFFQPWIKIGWHIVGYWLASRKKYSKKYMCSIGMGPLHLYCPSHGSQNHFNLNEKSFLTTQAFNDQRLLNAFLSYMWKRAGLFGSFSSPSMSSVCLLPVEKP